jgi:hypothetical protein
MTEDKKLEARNLEDKKYEEKKLEEKKELTLEDIIQLANRIGLEHADKRKESERFELMRTSVRAQIMNRIEEQSEKSIAEAKLKRLAEADPEYLDLLEKIASSRAESEKLRVRYESYRNLFDAKRTMISLKKVEMRHL